MTPAMTTTSLKCKSNIETAHTHCIIDHDHLRKTNRVPNGLKLLLNCKKRECFRDSTRSNSSKLNSRPGTGWQMQSAAEQRRNARRFLYTQSVFLLIPATEVWQRERLLFEPLVPIQASHQTPEPVVRLVVLIDLRTETERCVKKLGTTAERTDGQRKGELL
jgi:hypothetical protein